MGKLEGKVAVITGGSSGMALASARRFVEEGAYVFITGRRQEALDEAIKLIGRNVTGVRGDAANLDDLDRLFDTVKRVKGKIDILYASAGTGEAVPLGEITEQHFDATFGLNTRGTLFTVQKALDEAVKQIGRNVTGVRGDAADLDDLDRLFETVKREKGRIDILYASAGVGEALPLGEITEQHFDAAFNLNARGTLFTVQKALPLFNDGGSIFMTGSVASVKGFPGYSVYAASKAALHAFARGWLNELKDRNIRVNVLHPGPIATPMQDQVLTEEAKRMFESLIPRGKMGRPEEIAAVALFLASDDSSFVNGVELSVDGGFSAI